MCISDWSSDVCSSDLLQLTPDSDGFVFVVAGGSALGPFDGEGRISLPRGGQAVIGFDRLTVSGTVASGQIMPVADGLTGRLGISGGGVTGYVSLQRLGRASRGDSVCQYV